MRLLLLANTALAFSFVICGLLYRLGVLRNRLSASEALQFCYLLVGITFALILISPGIRSHSLFGSAVQVWSAPSHRADHEGITFSLGNTTIPAGIQQIPVIDWQTPLFALFALGALLTLFQLGRSVWLLSQFQRSSLLLKKWKRISIFASPDCLIPFSFRWPGLRAVVVPSSWASDPENLKIAIHHELQHHRQGDTFWVWMVQGIKLIAFFNPFHRFWEKSIAQLQEFACDEEMILRKSFSVRAYGSCLLKAAETTVLIPVGTTGMSDGSKKQLKRRIQMLCDYKPRKSKSLLLLVGTLSFTTLCSMVLGAGSFIRDQRITLRDAEELARNARSETNFPVVINEKVVEQLNRLVATPDGQKQVKAALERMEILRPMLEKRISVFALPKELLALPIIESGYENVPESSNPFHSAGVWQITPRTGRNFGMRVDAVVDDRMNIEKATDAALRLLGSDYLRFQDWQLSVLAYNAGETKVQNGIDALHSKDAWKLIEAGYEGDPNYLAKFMAAVLIYRNPKLAE